MGKETKTPRFTTRQTRVGGQYHVLDGGSCIASCDAAIHAEKIVEALNLMAALDKPCTIERISELEDQRFICGFDPATGEDECATVLFRQRADGRLEQVEATDVSPAIDALIGLAAELSDDELSAINRGQASFRIMKAVRRLEGRG